MRLIILALPLRRRRSGTTPFVIFSKARGRCNAMGGERIVVHPGGLGGLSREQAADLAGMTLKRALECLDSEGLSMIRVCPETMGKMNQLGNLDEVLTLCSLDERMLPCVDFGHLNARTHGGVWTVWRLLARSLNPFASGSGSLRLKGIPRPFFQNCLHRRW